MYSRLIITQPLLIQLISFIPYHCCPVCRSSAAQTPQAQSTPQSSTMQSPGSTPDSTPSTRDGGDSPSSVTLQMKQHYALANQRTPPTPDVRLYHRAVVVAQDTPGEFLVQACAPLLLMLLLLMIVRNAPGEQPVVGCQF